MHLTAMSINAMSIDAMSHHSNYAADVSLYPFWACCVIASYELYSVFLLSRPTVHSFSSKFMLRTKRWYLMIGEVKECREFGWEGEEW